MDNYAILRTLLSDEGTAKVPIGLPKAERPSGEKKAYAAVDGNALFRNVLSEAQADIVK